MKTTTNSTGGGRIGLAVQLEQVAQEKEKIDGDGFQGEGDSRNLCVIDWHQIDWHPRPVLPYGVYRAVQVSV